MNIRDFKKNPFFYLSIILTGVLIWQIAGIVQAQQYKSPTEPPVGGMPAVPLDTSSMKQFKAGELGIGTSSKGVVITSTIPRIIFNDGNKFGRIYLSEGKLMAQASDSQGGIPFEIGTGAGAFTVPLKLETQRTGTIGLILETPKNLQGPTYTPFITWQRKDGGAPKFSIRSLANNNSGALEIGVGDTNGFKPLLVLRDNSKIEAIESFFAYNISTSSWWFHSMIAASSLSTFNPGNRLDQLECDNNPLSQECYEGGTYKCKNNKMLIHGDFGYDLYEECEEGPTGTNCKNWANIFQFRDPSINYKIKNVGFITGWAEGFVGNWSSDLHRIGTVPFGYNENNCIVFLQGFKSEHCKAWNECKWTSPPIGANDPEQRRYGPGLLAACWLEGNKIMASYTGDDQGPGDGVVRCGYLCW